MRTSRKIMTPLAIPKAIESLTEAEKETLAILADEKIATSGPHDEVAAGADNDSPL